MTDAHVFSRTVVLSGLSAGGGTLRLDELQAPEGGNDHQIAYRVNSSPWYAPVKRDLVVRNGDSVQLRALPSSFFGVTFAASVSVAGVRIGTWSVTTQARPDMVSSLAGGRFPAVSAREGTVVSSSIKTVSGLGVGVHIPLLLRFSQGENCQVAINSDWNKRETDPLMRLYGLYVKNGDTLQLRCTVVKKDTTDRPTIVFPTLGVMPGDLSTLDWLVGIEDGPGTPAPASLGISCASSAVSAPGTLSCSARLQQDEARSVAAGYWVVTLPSGTGVQYGSCDDRLSCTFSFPAGSRGTHQIQGVILDAQRREVGRSNILDINVN